MFSFGLDWKIVHIWTGFLRKWNILELSEENKLCEENSIFIKRFIGNLRAEQDQVSDNPKRSGYK